MHIKSYCILWQAKQSAEHSLLAVFIFYCQRKQHKDTEAHHITVAVLFGLVSANKLTMTTIMTTATAKQTVHESQMY